MTRDPAKVVPPALYATVLAQVNRVRQAFGRKPLKRLPKGRPGGGERCPCPLEAALPNVTGVGSHSLFFDTQQSAAVAARVLRQSVRRFPSDTFGINQTRAMARFVRDFDSRAHGADA